MSPNPNVLIEYGYALSAIGHGWLAREEQGLAL